MAVLFCYFARPGMVKPMKPRIVNTIALPASAKNANTASTILLKLNGLNAALKSPKL